jgi:catechol 2,3-dioxygenase-like lactoylglutathione lyase family enzyme
VHHPQARKETRYESDVNSILLGVEDMDRSERFYTEGLGWEVGQDYGVSVFFEPNGGSLVGFYGRDGLAALVGTSPEGSGFSGMVLGLRGAQRSGGRRDRRGRREGRRHDPQTRRHPAALFGRRALAKAAGVCPDGTGSHRLVIGSDRALHRRGRVRAGRPTALSRGGAAQTARRADKSCRSR